MRTDTVPYADIADYLKREDTVLIPIGATEQYGPHLATGTELAICDLVATEVGEKTGFAVTPIVPFNFSNMFLDYPGTLTVEMNTVETYVSEMAHGLAHQGFRHFFFVNIHAGSLGPLESVSRSLRKKWGAVGGLIDVFSIMRDKGGVTYETKLAPTGHASEMVTSVALHKIPAYVHMDRVQAPPQPLRPFVEGVKTMSSGKVGFDGSTFAVFSDISDYTPLGQQGDASGATAEKGEIIWNNTIDYISAASRKFAKMVLAE